MHPLITVIGSIGSGKSTVSRIVSQELHIPLIDADLFETNPFLEQFIENPHRWAFSVELFFTIKRLKKLSSLPKLLKKSAVVVDSGLTMSHIFTQYQYNQGNITEAEWNFYQEIVADYHTNLPKNDLIMYLQTKPSTQLSRIKSRGRDFETGYTLKYLEGLTEQIETYLSQLQTQNFPPKIITLDTEKLNPTLRADKTIMIRKISQSLATIS